MAKQVVNDFSKGSIISNILRLSIPMTLAQLINVLYSIVDRIYIGRMGENSSLALTGVGVCLPIITIVIAFANLIGMGGAPLFSIKRGDGELQGIQIHHLRCESPDGELCGSGSYQGQEDNGERQSGC